MSEENGKASRADYLISGRLGVLGDENDAKPKTQRFSERYSSDQDYRAAVDDLKNAAYALAKQKHEPNYQDVVLALQLGSQIPTQGAAPKESGFFQKLVEQLRYVSPSHGGWAASR